LSIKAVYLLTIRFYYACVPLGKHEKKARVNRLTSYTQNRLMAKNKAAVALGKLRAKTLTTEERSKGGKVGGNARARALTKEQRQEIARKAAAARWGKKP